MARSRLVVSVLHISRLSRTSLGRRGYTANVSTINRGRLSHRYRGHTCTPRPRRKFRVAAHPRRLVILVILIVAVAVMGGQWKFVLLCISLFGDLVFGSMFPNTTPNSTPPPVSVTTQQEVVWPLKHLAAPAEVIAVKEVKTDDRGLHMEQAQEKNWESGQRAADVLPKVIVINDEQKPVGGVLIHNTTQDVDKKLPLTGK